MVYFAFGKILTLTREAHVLSNGNRTGPGLSGVQFGL